MTRALLVMLVCCLAPAARADVGLDALRATIRLKGGGQSGTGFVVAAPGVEAGPAALVLVTAAHVFENMDTEACTASFRARGPEGFVRRDVRLPIRDGERPLWTRHGQADVAVIAVAPPADADLGPVAADQLADAAAFERGDVRVGQHAWVACFPAQTEANAAGWPLLRQGTIATHPLAPVAAIESFFVDYAHFGGDSGAAVVVELDGGPLVAGVVVSMQRQTDRVTSPFEEKTVHTPLGLAIAIPADRVRETIDRWRERPEVEPGDVTPPGR